MSDETKKDNNVMLSPKVVSISRRNRPHHKTHGVNRTSKKGGDAKVTNVAKEVIQLCIEDPTSTTVLDSSSERSSLLEEAIIQEKPLPMNSTTSSHTSSRRSTGHHHHRSHHHREPDRTRSGTKPSVSEEYEYEGDISNGHHGDTSATTKRNDIPTSIKRSSHKSHSTKKRNDGEMDRKHSPKKSLSPSRHPKKSAEETKKEETFASPRCRERRMNVLAAIKLEITNKTSHSSSSSQQPEQEQSESNDDDYHDNDDDDGPPKTIFAELPLTTICPSVPKSFMITPLAAASQQVMAMNPRRSKMGNHRGSIFCVVGDVVGDVVGTVSGAVSEITESSAAKKEKMQRKIQKDAHEQKLKQQQHRLRSRGSIVERVTG